MASIGGKTVLRMRGNFEPGTGETVQDISRAGVAGTGFRKAGKRASPTQITTLVDLATSAAAKAEVEAYKELQGTLVTVVTEGQGTYTNVMVHRVNALPVRQVLSAVGGINAGSHLLRCQWVIQMTETS